MQWYSPFRRINSGTRFGHIPAALRCRRRHLAALPASGPGASASQVGRRLCWGLRLQRVGRRRCGGLRLPGVPHARRGLREKRMVQFGGWSTLFGRWSARVLFGGWSAPAVTHFSYLSFSADGLLHMSLICPFRRMVCRWSFLLAFTHFGGWSTHAVLLANGVHRPLHDWCRPCTLHPTLPQAQ